MKTKNFLWIYIMILIYPFLSVTAQPILVGQKRLFKDLNNLTDPTDDSGASRQATIYIDSTTGTLYCKLDAWDTTTGSAFSGAALATRYATNLNYSIGLSNISSLGTITIPTTPSQIVWGFTANIDPQQIVYFEIQTTINMQYGSDAFADRDPYMRIACVTDVHDLPSLTSPLLISVLDVSTLKTTFSNIGEVFTSNTSFWVTSDPTFNQYTYGNYLLLPLDDTDILINGLTYYVSGISSSLGKRLPVVVVQSNNGSTGGSSGTNAGGPGVGIGTVTPNSTLHVDGTFAVKVISYEGSSVEPIAIYNGYLLNLLPTGSDQIFILPDPSTVTGRIYVLYNTHAFHTCDIQGGSNSNIIMQNMSNAMITISPGEMISVISNGSNWIVMTVF